MTAKGSGNARSAITSIAPRASAVSSMPSTSRCTRGTRASTRSRGERLRDEPADPRVVGRVEVQDRSRAAVAPLDPGLLEQGLPAVVRAVLLLDRQGRVAQEPRAVVVPGQRPGAERALVHRRAARGAVGTARRDRRRSRARTGSGRPARRALARGSRPWSRGPVYGRASRRGPAPRITGPGHRIPSHPWSRQVALTSLSSLWPLQPQR